MPQEEPQHSISNSILTTFNFTTTTTRVWVLHALTTFWRIYTLIALGML
jgi:hypothetical protein